jgi:hypothetical protein
MGLWRLGSFLRVRTFNARVVITRFSHPQFISNTAPSITPLNDSRFSIPNTSTSCQFSALIFVEEVTIGMQQLYSCQRKVVSLEQIPKFRFIRCLQPSYAAYCLFFFVFVSFPTFSNECVQCFCWLKPLFSLK